MIEPAVSIEALVVGALPDADRELLRRGAVLRYITRDLATLVTGSDEAGGRLVAHPAVQGGGEGRLDELWTIPVDFRAALVSGWDDADAVRATVASGADGMEALYARLAATDTRAAALADLAARFAAALAAADVPLANDLLWLLDEWPVAGTADVEAVRRDLMPRLRRHSRALRDREATRTYVERDFERPLWEFLRADSQRWMLHLHAPGGRGKTLFTRNLLGRWCPEAGVPVARIDFDYVSQLGITTAEPWRLLLAAAGQLDPQLPGAPFEYLLDKYGELDASLRPEALPRTVTARAVDASAPVDELAYEAAVELPSSFAGKLAGADSVVVVLDTVENVLHTPGADLGPVLEAFGAVAEEAPGLQVVVSGRFDLTGDRAEPGAGTRPRVPGFRERWIGPLVESRAYGNATAQLGRAVVWLELPGFSEAEAERFLADRWQLPGPDIVAAVIARAGGNPMRLDLIAEYVTRTPHVTATDIASVTDPDLFYLVHRVVDRISDGRVQWLLRWGALLPVLTRESVEQVLWPALDAFAASRSDYDNARKDGTPASADDVERWEVPPVELVRRPGSLAEAWDGLLDYAAASSWVSVVTELPDAVWFHPEVREPIRGLLRRGGHPAYDDIHARAFTHWQHVAATARGATRAAAQRALLFHAYQPWGGRDHDGDRLFAELVAEAGDDRQARAKLAQEIVDAAGPSPTTVATAHVELAEALVAEAAQRGTPVPDARLSWHLQRAGAAERHRVEFLRGVLLDAGGDAAGAWLGIMSAVVVPRAREDSHLALVAAWVQSRTPPAAALDITSAVYATRADSPLGAPLGEALARGLLAAERWSEALAVATRTGIAELRCAAQIGQGMAAEVLAAPDSPRVWRARAQLLRLDPARALLELGATRKGEVPRPVEMLVRGTALAMLDRFGEAYDELSRATSTPDAAVAAAAGMEMARASAREGRFDVARSYLVRLSESADEIVRLRVAALSSLIEPGRPPTAARLMLSAAQSGGTFDREPPPSVGVEVAVARLALAGAALPYTRAAELRNLQLALTAVDGAGARLAALRDLTEVDGSADPADPDIAVRLRSLTEPPRSCPAALLLVRAELERVLGDAAAAAALLDDVSRLPSPQVGRAVDQARDRPYRTPAHAPTRSAPPDDAPPEDVVRIGSEADAFEVDVTIGDARLVDSLPLRMDDGSAPSALAGLVDLAVSRPSPLESRGGGQRTLRLVLDDEEAASRPWEAAVADDRWPAAITLVRGNRGDPRGPAAIPTTGVHVAVLDPRRDRGKVPALIRSLYGGRVPLTFHQSSDDPAVTSSGDGSWPADRVLHVIASPLGRRRVPGLRTAAGGILSAESMAGMMSGGPQLLVLDLTLVGSDADALDQLAVANAFCWQLVHQHPDLDVLCGTFAGGNDRVESLRRLVEHLIVGDRLVEIVADLQHHRPRLPDGRSPVRDIVSLSSTWPERRYLLRGMV